MLPKEQELIWQGRLHLGDDPGTFGDAAYIGLGCELPVTFTQPGPAEGGAPAGVPGRVTLVLHTEHMRTFPGYPGHEVVVSQLVPGVVGPRWSLKELTRERLRAGPESRVEVDLPAGPAPIHVTFALRVDTSAAPGVFDDFVVTRLSLVSPGFQYVASFGFHA